MNKEIKCPQCNGNKYIVINEEAYKCQYCGTTFNIKKENPTPTTDLTQSADVPTNVTVNVNMADIEKQLLEKKRIEENMREAQRKAANLEKERENWKSFLWIMAGILIFWFWKCS